MIAVGSTTIPRVMRPEGKVHHVTTMLGAPPATLRSGRATTQASGSAASARRATSAAGALPSTPAAGGGRPHSPMACPWPGRSTPVPPLPPSPPLLPRRFPHPGSWGVAGQARILFAEGSLDADADPVRNFTRALEAGAGASHRPPWPSLATLPMWASSPRSACAPSLLRWCTWST